MAHYLGAGRPKAARKTSVISFWCSLAVGFITGAAFVVLRDYIGRVFSDDVEVHRLTSQVCLLLGPVFFLLAALYTAFAVLDAQARPMMQALAMVIGGWGVSVPLAYVFAFPMGDGLIGLWYGMTIGYIVVSLIAGAAAVLSDWRMCSVQAMIRSLKHKAGEGQGKGEEEDGEEEEGEEEEEEEEDEEGESFKESGSQQEVEEEEKEEDPTVEGDVVEAEDEEVEEEEEEVEEVEVEEGEEDGEEEVEEVEEEDDEAGDEAEEKFVAVSMLDPHPHSSQPHDRRVWNAR